MKTYNIFNLLNITLSFLLITSTNYSLAQLRRDYYRDSCPNVESIVHNAVKKKMHQTSVTAPAPATLQLFFHDCFVHGCDASVLIASPNGNAEKDASADLSLAGDGFDTVIRAKAAVDSVFGCKYKVSCADILALAARDVVVLSGGPNYGVELGRRDGVISRKGSVKGHLPLAHFNYKQLKAMFATHGLSEVDLIALSEKGECSKALTIDGPMIETTMPSDTLAVSFALPNPPVTDLRQQARTQPERNVAYCNSKKLHELIGKLSSKQKSDVKSIGFGGLLEIQLTTFFQGMVPFLLGAYNGYGRRFKVGDTRECYLKPCDVYDVFMLPCETGKPVEETCHKRSDNPDSDLEQSWKDKFGIQPQKELYASILAAEMLKLPEGGDDFKRYFVLYAMGTLLAPTPHKNISLRLVRAVEDVNEIGKLDWCEYVLRKLDEGVNDWRSDLRKNVSGCLLFLQVIYFHRLKWRSHNTSSELPLIKHWTYESLKKRVVEEKVAAEKPGGCYGMGEWDDDSYPISKHMFPKQTQVGEVASTTVRRQSLVRGPRIISYELPIDVKSDEEIHAEAPNEYVELTLLIRRDAELFARLSIERATKMKGMAEAEKLVVKETRGSGIVDSKDEEMSELSQFWTEQLKKPDVLKVIDGWVNEVMEAAEHARMMPSFDLGLDEIFANDIPRYNTRSHVAGLSKKFQPSKKQKK